MGKTLEPKPKHCKNCNIGKLLHKSKFVQNGSKKSTHPRLQENNDK